MALGATSACDCTMRGSYPRGCPRAPCHPNQPTSPPRRAEFKRARLRLTIRLKYKRPTNASEKEPGRTLKLFTWQAIQIAIQIAFPKKTLHGRDADL